MIESKRELGRLSYNAARMARIWSELDTPAINGGYPHSSNSNLGLRALEARAIEVFHLLRKLVLDVDSFVLSLDPSTPTQRRWAR